ncbi:MAG TPA: two-component regulator propeller domain-containing protein [Verrucomicrobiae bacterium]|jgi:signal transduction histidine kinase/ligand-binding sensor domain-containing protein|nr:two-component regulator propeller domain-containing protein [Verrucomicrobiae bacterium]
MDYARSRLTRYSWIAAGILAVATVSAAAAGERASDYVVTSWHMQDGLPSDRVRSVLQTRDGYIWVATFNGIARFDGVRFQRFNDANTPELQNSLANCLFEDSQRRLWVGSDTGEIAWRDSTGFHPLIAPTNWPSAPIDRFVQASDGQMYAVERGGTVLCFRDCTAQEVVGSERGPQYSDLATDRQGRVWAVRFGGTLFRFEHERAIGDGPAPAAYGYRDVAGARHGGIWVRDGNRLRRWDNGNWVEDRGTHSWNAQRGVTMYEDPIGNVWVGTVDKGLSVVAPDGSETHVDRSNGLGNDLVSSITSDQEQNVWVGTDGGGLQLLRHRVLFMVSPPDHWQNRAVLSVSPARDGGVWVGTEGAGVYKLNGGQFTKLKGPESPAAHDIRSVLQDRAGTLWAGTQGAGLLRSDNNGALVTVTNPELPMSLQLFYALYEDTGGSIWMGTQDGATRFDKGQWSHLGTELYRAEVRCVCQTPDGAIWIGMRGGGVARYQSGKFTQYLRPQGLTYEYISCLFADHEGSVWIGTPGAGLIRWRNGVFDNFTTRDGLPSDFICNIQQDSAGHFWIGSYAGIFRVAKNSLERAPEENSAPLDYILLDNSDGLASLEIAGGNQPSACATADGRLWYATSGGLAMVDPARIKPNGLPPPVLLEEVLVDGKPVPFQGVSADDSVQARVIAPPGGGSIEFRYTALSYSAPQRCRFRYRLEKFDSQWIEAGTRRAAYYSRLPPRDYRFDVIACNSDGVWNTTGAVISFTVLPYFWERWWFGPLCWISGLSVLAALILGIVRQRHRRRLEAMDRARLVERERLRIARDLHDDLGGGLTEISMSSALAQDPALSTHEARQYFQEISGRSVEMVNALDEIVWAVNPKNDDLNSLVIYICQYAERFLQPASLSCRFQIPNQLPAIPLDAEQRHNLFLAWKEALHNVVKHSAASGLRLSVTVESKTLRMTLEDDGRGFAENGGTPEGDGLRNMRERLRQLGGHCEIASAPGRGTRVIFTLPL